MVITTDPNPIEPHEVSGPRGVYVRKTSAEINLAKWYNLGFEAAIAFKDTTEVLWMESDVRITPQGVHALQSVLRQRDLSLVGPDFHGRTHPQGLKVALKYDNSPIPYTDRVCQCSMAPAESPLRMDERFRWWYEADDLEFRARLAKGTGLVYGTGATHAGQLSWDMPRELKDKAKAGEQLFREIWGKTPFED